MKSTIKTLWKFLSNKKWKLLIGILLAFMGTVATLIGTYSIKPIINNYIIPQDFNGLLKGIAVLVIIFFVGTVSSCIQIQVILRVAYSTLKGIREKLFSKIQSLPIAFFDKQTHGNILSLFTNDIEALQTSLEQSIVMLLTNIVQIIGTLVLMFLLSKKLIILTIIMTFFILLPLQLMGKKIQKYFNRQQNDIGILSGVGEEMISGHQDVLAFNFQERAKVLFKDKNNRYRISSSRAQALSGAIMPIVNQMNSINFALTAIVGALFVLDNQLDIGSLSAYLTLTINYNEPFKQLAVQASNVMQGLAGAGRIFRVLEQNEEMDKGDVTLEKSRHQIYWKMRGTKKRIPFKGKINISHVDFSYDESEGKVLKNISIQANPGEKVALIGSTGSGKTTITNLINRLYGIKKGTITIDNINITDICLKDLRSAMGFVLQDTHLFTGTIYDNIRYGDLNASNEEVIAAAKLVHADHLISQLPKGYDTLLINDGENISVGQRQLISIARTALSNPAILILDEATSSVDSRTEYLVNTGMDELMKNRTVIVIAHRLSTIRDAAEIIVLENGEIIEKGNHKALMNKHGRYYEINEGIAQLS